MAEQADKHILYEGSVQSVDDEVEFLQTTYRTLRDKEPRSLREDFCGTANAACAWVRQGPEREAVAVDINADVLDWGRRHHVAALEPSARARIKLLETDVRTVDIAPVDIAVAFNFSYWIFKDRPTMVEYFRNVRAGLKDDGLFFIDVYGGSDAHEEMKEKTKYDGFTYVWHQADYDPVSGHMTCYIHFKFPDGSKLKKAFRYHWRLWSMPEVRELLAEAGFSKSTVYWQQEDEDGEQNGEFAPCVRGDADPAWIAYVVAEK